MITAWKKALIDGIGDIFDKSRFTSTLKASGISISMDGNAAG